MVGTFYIYIYTVLHKMIRFDVGGNISGMFLNIH